jgi:hypothetical protein
MVVVDRIVRASTLRVTLSVARVHRVCAPPALRVLTSMNAPQTMVVASLVRLVLAPDASTLLAVSSAHTKRPTLCLALTLAHPLLISCIRGAPTPAVRPVLQAIGVTVVVR